MRRGDVRSNRPFREDLMDRFKTVDDVVRWFTDGQRGDLCYDAADIRDLVERMVSLPDPFRTSWGPERRPTHGTGLSSMACW
jgi:hypothetical protein